MVTFQHYAPWSDIYFSCRGPCETEPIQKNFLDLQKNYVASKSGYFRFLRASLTQTHIEAYKSAFC